MKKVTVIIPVWNQEKLVIDAIESLPERDDIEIIVIDDGSTDNTFYNVRSYRDNNPQRDVVLLYNEKNLGVADTVNKGLDNARGEYVVLLGSDDYMLASKFEKAMAELDGTDLVYFDIRVNSGDVWEVNESTKDRLCGSVKFMRREFVGDTRCPSNRRIKEDWFFYKALMNKNPTEKFLGYVVKHYNWPRAGSLCATGGKNKG